MRNSRTTEPRACTHKSPSHVVRFRVIRTLSRHGPRTEPDPMYGPAVRCKGKPELECTVLHQCIRPRVGADAPDHHGNPRAPELISGHASKGYVGHQFSDALERPFLHLLFFSRRPRWAKDRVALTSRFSLSRALRPNSRGLGCGLHRPDLEVATAMEDAPGHAGDFIGKRNRQLEPVEPPGCSLDPGFEAMLLPALRAK